MSVCLLWNIWIVFRCLVSACKLYLQGNADCPGRISDLGENNECLLAVQAPSVLNGFSQDFISVGEEA